MQQTHRSRPLWAGLIAVVIVFGLGTRSPALPFSRGITSCIGDAAWALAVFFGYGLLLPGLSTVKIVVLAATTSLLVELSQLYHGAWIDAIRGSTLGHLILGSGFDPLDLVYYSIGLGVGALIEAGLFRMARKRS